MIKNENELRKHIAMQLKSLRQERKLSLDATAMLTGVSKAMLGQIERQESSPTIAKLWQIASGLNVSFSVFIRPDLPIDQRQSSDSAQMVMETLLPYDPETRCEVFVITLTNFHEQCSMAHAKGVIETIWVIEGELEISLENGCISLKTGASFRFHAAQHHQYKAVSENVRFQNIIHYPLCS